MLHRQIISRLLKPNLWVGRNGAATLAGSALDKGYVISYLQTSCGLSLENAIRASKYVHFDGPHKPNAVVDFLGKQGFTQSQIAKMVIKFPGVLVANPETRLLPKLEFLLHSTGVSEREIPEIVCKNSGIFRRAFNRKLASIYNYVKSVIGAGKADDLLRKASWIFSIDLEGKLKPNVDYLREVGLSERHLKLAFFHYVRIFHVDPVEFKRIVEEVKQMGFDPSKSTFLMAIHARSTKGLIDLWDQSTVVYSKWGWTEEDIRMAYTKSPNCMVFSEKNISKTLDFLVNKIGVESRRIARYSNALSYSLEERIVPRCCVVHVLWLEGLIKKDWKLSSVLGVAEDKFLEKFVSILMKFPNSLRFTGRTKQVALLLLVDDAQTLCTRHSLLPPH